MCDEAVHDCLAARKFIRDWFATGNKLGKFHDALLANDDIHFFDKNFSKVTFFANKIGIFGVDLEKFNDLDNDHNFDKYDSEIIIYAYYMDYYIDFWLAVIYLKKAKDLKEIQAKNACSVAFNKVVGLVNVRR